MAKKRKNSRRANGEGSIVQRKDGRWCGVVTLGYKPDGKIKGNRFMDIHKQKF